MTLLELKVVPSSGQQKWVLDATGMLKCYVKSPPEDGKANKELIGLIARAIGVPKKDIIIAQGASSRKKLIKIPVSISRDEFLKRVGLDQQLSF